MNYKLLHQLELEENSKIKKQNRLLKQRVKELELRLKHKQQPKLLKVLNIFLLNHRS